MPAGTLLSNRPRQYERYGGDQPVDPMPGGDYLQIKRTEGFDRTANQDCWTLWDLLNREAQGVSVQTSANTPVPSRDIVGKTIDAINRCFAGVSMRVVSRANSLFTDTYGGPAAYSFEPYPIRWNGEQRFALMSVQEFVSCCYHLIHVRSNCLDNGLLENHAITLLAPLIGLKTRIMRDWFSVETKGNISPNELQAIFRNSKIAPPLISSLDDTHDLPADSAAEDARAKSNESAQVPDDLTIQQITSGVEVWTWVPTHANWTVFGEILRRMETSNPESAPAEPFPFTTDLISSGATSEGDETAPAAPGGLVTPS